MERKRGVLFFILIFLLIGFGSAYVSVSPAFYELNFKHGMKESFSFNFDSDNSENVFEIYAEGDLAQYVKLSTDKIKGRGTVDVELEFPDKIELPGKHRLYIGAKQLASETGGVGIVANIRGVIKVFVPYHGKYIELEFFSSDKNVGEKVPFSLEINNGGEEDVVVDSRIEIFNSENILVEQFLFGKEFIPSTENKEYKYDWDSKNVEAGNYIARAIVGYGDNEAKADSGFRLGELRVDIINYSNVLEDNKVNPFFVEVESFYNNDIEVYADVEVIGSEVRFQTPSENLGAWKRKKLIGYLDTKELKGKKFEARIVVHYEGKTTEKIVNFKIKGGKIDYKVYVLVVVLVILASGLVWFVFKFKGLRRVNEKKIKKSKKNRGKK